MTDQIVHRAKHDIEKDLEHARPRAKHERVFASVAGGRQNPWHGQSDRVASLEKELEDIALRAEGEALLREIEKFRTASAQETAYQIESSQLAAELAQFEKTNASFLVRWDSMKLANMAWVGFVEKVESQAIRRDPYPIMKDQPQPLFTAEELEIAHSRAALRLKASHAAQNLGMARGTRHQLEMANPLIHEFNA